MLFLDAYQWVNRVFVYLPVIEFSSLDPIIIRYRDNTFISVLMDKIP